jgi:peroxiredoxin Q/BCP
MWFSKPLPVGSPAPDFELPDESGGRVRLSDFRGRNVVLVFYPGDDTPVCTRQLCEFRDHWGDAEARNIAVLGINPWSAASHEKFRKKHSFPFPLLADAGQAVGALYSTKGIWVRRTVYLIGPDGTIRYARRGKPDASEVLQAAV